MPADDELAEGTHRTRTPKLSYTIMFAVVVVVFPIQTVLAYQAGTGYPMFLGAELAFVPGLIGGSILWVFSAFGLWIIVDGIREGRDER